MARASSQAEVRQTMIDAGGYWRPLAAVARLLEELAELAELLEPGNEDGEELASELADLWIITAALADQFLIEVPDPGSGGLPGHPWTLSELLIAAGPLGRVVNFYDGPKTPGSDGLPSLTETIGVFHERLEGLSGSLGVDLARAVREKLALIRARDMERFGPSPHDPSTAEILGQAGGVAGRRLWGAPALTGQMSEAEQAEALAPSLGAFTKAAVPERLEGYVIGLPIGPETEQPERWLGRILAELARIDPRLSPSGPQDGKLRLAGIELELELLQGPPESPPTRSLLLGRSGMLLGPGGDRM